MKIKCPNCGGTAQLTKEPIAHISQGLLEPYVCSCGVHISVFYRREQMICRDYDTGKLLKIENIK